MVPGTYRETYTCKDHVGLTSHLVRTIVIVDKRLPLLLMRGSNPTRIEAAPGRKYRDAGARCTDEIDGDLSKKVVVSGNNVNGEVPKSYYITYNCKDSSGNSAVPLKRTVIVVDSGAPTLYMKSRKFMVIEASFPYNDPGCTAYDSLDGDLTKKIQSNAKSVNPFKRAHVASEHPGDMGYGRASTNGVYHIKYTVKDSQGNRAKPLTRTVVVKDTLPPVITLKRGGVHFGHDNSVKFNKYPFNAPYSNPRYAYKRRTQRTNIGGGAKAYVANTGTGSFRPQQGYLALNEQSSTSYSTPLFVGLAVAGAGLALVALSKKRQSKAKTFVMV